MAVPFTCGGRSSWVRRIIGTRESSSGKVTTKLATVFGSCVETDTSVGRELVLMLRPCRDIQLGVSTKGATVDTEGSVSLHTRDSMRAFGPS